MGGVRSINTDKASKEVVEDGRKLTVAEEEELGCIDGLHRQGEAKETWNRIKQEYEEEERGEDDKDDCDEEEEREAKKRQEKEGEDDRRKRKRKYV